MQRKSMVSSLSMAFKKAATVTEDREEAKKEHRETLKFIMDKYTDDVQNGKADGIRNAKELVEVMKMDLLLMGEATERTDNVNNFDEIRVNRISRILDADNDNVKAIMAEMMKSLNDANDEADTGTHSMDIKPEGDNEGVTLDISDEELLEMANEAMNEYAEQAMNEEE